MPAAVRPAATRCARTLCRLRYAYGSTSRPRRRMLRDGARRETASAQRTAWQIGEAGKQVQYSRNSRHGASPHARAARA